MPTQQQECYAAERELRGGRAFMSVEEVQSFVDGLRDLPWWTAQGFHLAVARIEVGKSRSKKHAGVGWYDAEMGGGRIELTGVGLNMKTVLHEVAHVIASAKYGSKSHDPWWARTYLTLVSYVMGTESYLTLQSAFDGQGVDYDVTTGRPGVIAL
jgi:putative metallohydrolase (TIGR04338 family)